MKTRLKKPIIFISFLLPISVVAGLFTASYIYDGYSTQMQQILLTQMGGYKSYLLAITLQTVVYAVVCGFFCFILADKVGLMRPFKLENAKWQKAVLLGVIGGFAFSLDYRIFGRMIPEAATACTQITVSSLIASVLYGGIIEEVMLRLFVMSLISLLLWKLFYRTKLKEEIPSGVFVTANILSALLFAAGHLPATFLSFENVGALVIFRCFLYNGGLGLIFGYLYRKYGIQYAMIGHILCHVVSKAIWIIAV